MCIISIFHKLSQSKTMCSVEHQHQNAHLSQLKLASWPFVGRVASTGTVAHGNNHHQDRNCPTVKLK